MKNLTDSEFIRYYEKIPAHKVRLRYIKRTYEDEKISRRNTICLSCLENKAIRRGCFCEGCWKRRLSEWSD